MIVMTGATGTVGTMLMDRLAAEGQRVRAVCRSDRSRDTVTARGHAPVDGDLDHPDSLVGAFDGCSRLFVLSPAHPDQARREIAALDAARRAGVSHAVVLSVAGADPGSGIGFIRAHGEVEAHLAASGPAHTVIRPAGFMQTHLWPVGTVAGDGHWYGMTGDGAAAFVAAEDVAACAAAALVRPTERSEVIEVTGPAAISMPEAAGVLGDVLGRQVTYIDLPEEQFHSALLGAGLPGAVADDVVALYRAVRAGHATTVTDGVERLTGSPATPYRRFAERHRAEMSPR